MEPEPMLSYCGYRCDKCLARIYTLAGDDHGLLLTVQGWESIFGFHMEVERARCTGCKGGGRPVDSSCKVRPCCSGRGFSCCSECPERPCQDLEEKIVDRDAVEARLGRALSQPEYEAFIEPYESRRRLMDEKKKG